MLVKQQCSALWLTFTGAAMILANVGVCVKHQNPAEAFLVVFPGLCEVPGYQVHPFIKLITRCTFTT